MLEIQRHLEGCRSCAKEYQATLHVKELLRSLRVQEPVGPLETRIAQSVSLEDRASIAWPPLPLPQAGRRFALAVALSGIALFAITPSFAPPAAGVPAHTVPLAFQSQTAFGDQLPGTVLRASPATLSLLLAQPAPNAEAWRVAPSDPYAAGADSPPPLVNVGAEPLGDPAADGYVALADYRAR